MLGAVIANVARLYIFDIADLWRVSSLRIRCLRSDVENDTIGRIPHLALVKASYNDRRIINSVHRPRSFQTQKALLLSAIIELTLFKTYLEDVLIGGVFTHRLR